MGGEEAVQLGLRRPVAQSREREYTNCHLEGALSGFGSERDQGKFYEKQIAIENRTQETAVVWIQRLTREPAEQGQHWVWKPSAPGEGQARRRLIPPGSVVLLREEGDGAEGPPLRACCIRIWGESEGGRRWDQDRRRNLWVVEANAELRGERAYHAREMQTFVHSLQPSLPNVFDERLVEFRNETSQTLEVQCRFRVRDRGQVTWETARFSLPAGQSIHPRRASGLRARASQMLFAATGEDRRFIKHASSPLWLVQESPQGRVYRGNEIGQFIHVFRDVPAASALKTGAAQ